MSTIHRFKVEKMVRDNVMNRATGRGAVHMSAHNLAPAEHVQALKEKLREEAEEAITAQDKTELMDELADVLEVIQAFAFVSGFSMADIEKARVERKEERGGFEKGVYCEYIEVAEGSLLYNYYKENDKKYPEIKRS